MNWVRQSSGRTAQSRTGRSGQAGGRSGGRSGARSAGGSSGRPGGRPGGRLTARPTTSAGGTRHREDDERRTEGASVRSRERGGAFERDRAGGAPRPAGRSGARQTGGRREGSYLGERGAPQRAERNTQRGDRGPRRDEPAVRRGRGGRPTTVRSSNRDERPTRSRDRQAPSGFDTDEDGEAEPEFVAGRRPVLEALKAGRPINKIVVAEKTEGGSLSEILGKAKDAGVMVQRAPRAHLNEIAGERHQGVLAYIAPHEYVELDTLIARETGQPPLVVLLDEITDPHNFGAILRTAEASGAQGVVIPKRRSAPLTGVVAKAAAGALEYVPVARVPNLVQAMEQLQAAGYWIVGTAVEGATLYTESDFRGKVAVVIGAEGAGLGRLVKERCDFLVRLPMLGHVESLNASVAAGVLLYEIVRQRA